MNDTHPEIAKLYHQLLMAKTGEERLIMGCSMFDFAKSIVSSAIKNENPGLSQFEIKKELFKRFYANDFSETQKQRILVALLK